MGVTTNTSVTLLIYHVGELKYSHITLYSKGTHVVIEVVDMAELLDRIVVDPNILAGKPVIKGTRIPVYLIIDLLATGVNVKDVLKEYPELKENDVKSALLYASRLLEREITVAL